MLNVRGLPRKPVELVNRDRALGITSDQDFGIERNEGNGEISRINGDAGIAGAKHRMVAVDTLQCGTPEPGVRLLQFEYASGSRKYVQRVRCIRLPPIDAMLRSCAEAARTGFPKEQGRRP